MNLWGDYFLNDFNAINSPRLIILAIKMFNRNNINTIDIYYIAINF